MGTKGQIRWGHCHDGEHVINFQSGLELTRCRGGIEIVTEVPTRLLLLPTGVGSERREKTSTCNELGGGRLTEQAAHAPARRRHHSRAHLSANGGYTKPFPVSSSASSTLPSSSSYFYFTHVPSSGKKNLILGSSNNPYISIWTKQTRGAQMQDVC